MLATKQIERFLDEQVQNGNCTSTIEAEQALVKVLVERDIDRGIEAGREAMKNGNYRVMNAETNKAFIDELVKEILPQST